MKLDLPSELGLLLLGEVVGVGLCDAELGEALAHAGGEGAGAVLKPGSDSSLIANLSRDSA